MGMAATGIICAEIESFARLPGINGACVRNFEAAQSCGIRETTKLSSSVEETRFTFDRGRGVVWVCDIQDSSKMLNDNESALAFEEYLQRLHWLGRMAIGAAGGHFIKWTGDGFLGWFPLALQRDLGTQAANVLQAIWHLSLINNVTRLGVNTNAKLRLRHGLTMEHDALITTVSDEHGTNLDLLGRSVVLAFRLAGIKTSFPNIVTQREIVEESSGNEVARVEFKRLHLSADDRLRYFKGERFGTATLYKSTERKYRTKSRTSLLSMIRDTISDVENPATDSTPVDTTTWSLVCHLQSGPQWTREVLKSYVSFLREDLLGALKSAASALESPVRG